MNLQRRFLCGDYLDFLFLAELAANELVFSSIYPREYLLIPLSFEGPRNQTNPRAAEMLVFLELQGVISCR